MDEIERDIILKNLMIKMFLVVLLTIAGFAFGMLASIPVNFVVDAEEAKVIWFGGGISSFDRLMDHRMRSFFTGLFFAYVFYHTGISSMQRVFHQLKHTAKLNKRD